MCYDFKHTIQRSAVQIFETSSRVIAPGVSFIGCFPSRGKGVFSRLPPIQPVEPRGVGEKNGSHPNDANTDIVIETLGKFWTLSFFPCVITSIMPSIVTCIMPCIMTCFMSESCRVSWPQTPSIGLRHPSFNHCRI